MCSSDLRPVRRRRPRFLERRAALTAKRRVPQSDTDDCRRDEARGRVMRSHTTLQALTNLLMPC